MWPGTGAAKVDQRHAPRRVPIRPSGSKAHNPPRWSRAPPRSLTARCTPRTPAAQLRPVLVKGATGAVITVDGRPIALMGFTVTAGKMTTSDIITDTEHPAHIDLGTTGD
jgi:hypothetical protein